MMRKWSCLMMVALSACSKSSSTARWPESLAPGEAALFSHNEIEINAPCQRVWSILIAARQWPRWYTNASNVELAGPATELERGRRFRWTTFGIAVQSQVHEFEPPSRLGWYGQAEGITAYHTWSLHSLPSGCHVVTEETNNGPVALGLRHDKPDAIHDGHATWLEQLKATSEK